MTIDKSKLLKFESYNLDLYIDPKIDDIDEQERIYLLAEEAVDAAVEALRNRLAEIHPSLTAEVR